MAIIGAIGLFLALGSGTLKTESHLKCYPNGSKKERNERKGMLVDENGVKIENEEYTDHENNRPK